MKRWLYRERRDSTSQSSMSGSCLGGRLVRVSLTEVGDAGHWRCLRACMLGSLGNTPRSVFRTSTGQMNVGASSKSVQTQIILTLLI